LTLFRRYAAADKAFDDKIRAAKSGNMRSVAVPHTVNLVLCDHWLSSVWNKLRRNRLVDLVEMTADSVMMAKCLLQKKLTNITTVAHKHKYLG
jgi:acyl carrier protein phosphodiesterase